MPSKESASEQLAALLAKTVASQVIGAAASELISNPLLSLLNISDTSQQEFQQDVLNQLEGIRDQLKDVQASLTKINSAVEALQQTINTYAISSALAGYYKTATQIHSRYRFFVDGVAALANPKGDHPKALADMYVRLSPPADATVSDAMDEIHSFVVPNSGVQGLFDFILTGMRDAMTAYAQDGIRYTIPKLGEYADYWIPTEGGMFATRRLLTGGLDAGRDYLTNLAVPLMKHVLATQVKGLMLLSRAWAGGLHDDRIGDYVDNILDHVARMKKFFADRAVPTARALTPVNLQTYGKRLRGDTLKNGIWMQLPLSATGPNRTLAGTGAILYNDDWVMWEIFPDLWYQKMKGFPMPSRDDEWKYSRTLVFVHRPWEGGTRPAYLLGWSGQHQRSAVTQRIHQKWQFTPNVGDYYTILSPAEFLTRTEAVNFISERLGQLAVDGDGQVGITIPAFSDTPPAPLSDMLKTLPTKRDELHA